MPQTVTTLEKDTLDQVVFRTLGTVNETLLEAAFDLNPALANYGPLLPYGISIEVPDAPDSENVKRTIKLYD